MSTRSITVRLPDELHKYLAERAEKEHRTLSNMIIDMLANSKETVNAEDKMSGGWYRCSGCKKYHITNNFNFCPDCGKRIEWSYNAR